MAPETLRFVGTLADRQVVLLVDGGSTHNFIQAELVSQLGLPCQPTLPLRVMVGNGQTLECNSLCSDVTVIIQSAQFVVDLHVLPISGANIVLGVQWLKSLSPVLTDYTTLTMQFFQHDRMVELKGDTDAHLRLLSSPQFRRLYWRQGDGVCFQITMLPPESDSVDTTSLPRELQSLLLKYEALFQHQQALPPQRDTDHHIHLLP